MNNRCNYNEDYTIFFKNEEESKNINKNYNGI